MRRECIQRLHIHLIYAADVVMRPCRTEHDGCFMGQHSFKQVHGRGVIHASPIRLGSLQVRRCNR